MTSAELSRHLARIFGRSPDPWPDALACVAGATDAEVAIALAVGPPVRRLATLGPMSTKVTRATDEPSLVHALEGAGLACRWLQRFHRGERTLGVIALASRRPDPLTAAERDALDDAVPLLTLAMEASVQELALDGERAIRRRLEDRLAEVERRSTVGAVAAAVAHDMAAPISALTMELRELRDRVRELDEQLVDGRPMLRNLLDDLRGLSDHCADSTERARQLLIDFRLAAHPHPGPSPRAGLLTSVGDALRCCVRLVTPLARNEVQLELVVAPDLPMIPGSRQRLEQAFTNLLVNAVHAAAVREGRAGRVEARALRMDGEIVVEISDNGPGIPPEYMARIFEPFFTTKGPDMGTGLGLPITRDAVEAHGGRLEVVSERGRGACFRVRLPVAAATAAAASTSGGTRAHILVVDDDESVLRAMERILRSDFEVTLADGGSRALELLEAGATFDAMIVDLSMPELGGEALYARIRERWPGMERRIVFATGGAFTAATRRFLETVPNTRFEKPISRAELRPLVHRVVSAA